MGAKSENQQVKNPLSLGDNAQTGTRPRGFNFQPLSEDEKREFGSPNKGAKILTGFGEKRRRLAPTAA